MGQQGSSTKVVPIHPARDIEGRVTEKPPLVLGAVAAMKC
jgi:hypothetical protein